MTSFLCAWSYTVRVMYERNDEALNRPSHGRAIFGTYDSELGMESYLTEMSTPSGRVAVIFEGRKKVRVTVCHPEQFFRTLERAWNHTPDFGNRDIHSRFQQVAESGASSAFGLEQRALVVSEFLAKAASALEALSVGQRSEVASLEEHARQIRLTADQKEQTS